MCFVFIQRNVSTKLNERVNTSSFCLRQTHEIIFVVVVGDFESEYGCLEEKFFSVEFRVREKEKSQFIAHLDESGGTRNN